MVEPLLCEWKKLAIIQAAWACHRPRFRTSVCENSTSERAQGAQGDIPFRPRSALGFRATVRDTVSYEPSAAVSMSIFQHVQLTQLSC